MPHDCGLCLQYLQETLALYGDRHGENEAAFIRRLFFTEDTHIPERPKELQAAAITSMHINEETFRKRRRAYFRQFALFLLELDAGAAPVAAEAVTNPEAAETEQPEALPASQPRSCAG